MRAAWSGSSPRNHLVFFKLYSGGNKSLTDVLELLSRNDVDINALRAMAKRFRMTRQLNRVLPRS